MSVINLTEIQVLNNPARFQDPYTFKITFECISELTEGEADYAFATVLWKALRMLCIRATYHPSRNR